MIKFRLKVLCNTEVYDMESIQSKAKKTRGFLNTQAIPVDRKNRNPSGHAG